MVVPVFQGRGIAVAVGVGVDPLERHVVGAAGGRQQGRRGQHTEEIPADDPR